MNKYSLEETKKLNNQSATNGGSNASTNAGMTNMSDASNMSSSASDSTLAETKQLNNQSASNNSTNDASNSKIGRAHV